jgi:hypothetical protein
LDRVTRVGEGRYPFSVDKMRVPPHVIDVQVGADDEIDCLRRESGRRQVREGGGVVVLAAGIDEVGLEPRLGGNVCGRGFGEEVDGERP